MLNQNRRFFVAAGENLKSVLEAWANENTMKLKGEDVRLETCKRAYELDVQFNEDLAVRMRLLGVGYQSFMNGEKSIGRVQYDFFEDVRCTVVYPEIKDR